MKIPNLHPGGTRSGYGIFSAVKSTIPRHTWIAVSGNTFAVAYNATQNTTWEALMSATVFTTEEIE